MGFPFISIQKIVFFGAVGSLESNAGALLTDPGDSGSTSVAPTLEKYIVKLGELADLIGEYQSLIFKDAADMRKSVGFLVTADKAG